MYVAVPRVHEYAVYKWYDISRIQSYYYADLEPRLRLYEWECFVLLHRMQPFGWALTESARFQKIICTALPLGDPDCVRAGLCVRVCVFVCRLAAAQWCAMMGPGVGNKIYHVWIAIVYRLRKHYGLSMQLLLCRLGCWISRSPGDR